MGETNLDDVFKRLQFDEEGQPITPTGWRPVDTFDEQDLEQELKRAKGPAVDLDRLMAMPPRDTFLFRFLDLALKKYHNDPNYKWKNQYQKFGTCVGQAAKVAVDDLMALCSILYDLEFQGRSAVAGSYTFARVEIEGRPGRQEGANGVNAATAFLRLGVLLLKYLGLPDDALDADENLAMQWTNSRQGVPQRYEDMAKNVVVGDVVHPDGTKMAARLLQGGAPQFVGTTYIPTGVCDSRGISPCKRGRQGHEMAVRAVIYENGEPYAFLQQQSWYSGWAKGTRLTTDQPPESVWISAADYAKQMADGDCSAIIGVNGLSYNG